MAAPVRVLGIRAVVGYPLLRALIFVTAALVGTLAGPEIASGLESPIGVVALAGVLGLVDVRRRGETIFWANLGYSPAVAPSVFGLVAVVGELLLAGIGAAIRAGIRA
jgi:hypothetical protein